MANPNVLLDYLFLGPLIEERVRAVVPDLDSVDGIEALSQAVETNVVAQRVFVQWGGEQFNTTDAGRSGGGANQIVTHTWVVILAKRHASQTDRSARNHSAGATLSALHKALAGWTPEGAYKPLRRANGPKPNYNANVALYPLSFSIDLSL